MALQPQCYVMQLGSREMGNPSEMGKHFLITFCSYICPCGSHEARCSFVFHCSRYIFRLCQYLYAFCALIHKGVLGCLIPWRNLLKFQLAQL